MVQLKVLSSRVAGYTFGNFNSSMVQLKENKGLRVEAIQHISIPLWYN